MVDLGVMIVKGTSNACAARDLEGLTISYLLGQKRVRGAANSSS
jgi:hypothetical protein